MHEISWQARAREYPCRLFVNPLDMRQTKFLRDVPSDPRPSSCDTIEGRDGRSSESKRQEDTRRHGWGRNLISHHWRRISKSKVEAKKFKTPVIGSRSSKGKQTLIRAEVSELRHSSWERVERTTERHVIFSWRTLISDKETFGRHEQLCWCAEKKKLVNKIYLLLGGGPPRPPIYSSTNRQLINFQQNPRLKFFRSYSPRNFCVLLALKL